MQVRCPKCGRFGSPALNNYCKLCANPTDIKPNRNTKHVFGTFESDFTTNGVFIPDRFGIVKDKFGYQDRYGEGKR